MSNFVNLLDIVYPRGSIYITINNVSPAASVGGTWEKIENKFLKSAAFNESPSTIGGNERHYHKVMMAYQEYHGWGNVSGNQDNGFAVTSGIIDVANAIKGTHGLTGSDGITLEFASLKPWYRDYASANYVSSIMVQNECHVESTYVDTQEGTTSISSNLPPYYVVYMYKRIA